MRKFLLGIAAVGAATTALPAVAAAQPGYGGYYAHPADRNGDGVVTRREARRTERQADRYNQYYGNSYGNGYGGGYGQGYGGQYSRYYSQQGYYNGPTWRGNDGRYRCHRSDGTAGTVVGAGVGALIGSQVAGRGDRTIGAVLGGALGALLGSQAGNSNSRYRCN